MIPGRPPPPDSERHGRRTSVPRDAGREPGRTAGPRAGCGLLRRPGQFPPRQGRPGPSRLAPHHGGARGAGGARRRARQRRRVPERPEPPRPRALEPARRRHRDAPRPGPRPGHAPAQRGRVRRGAAARPLGHPRAVRPGPVGRARVAPRRPRPRREPVPLPVRAPVRRPWPLAAGRRRDGRARARPPLGPGAPDRPGGREPGGVDGGERPAGARAGPARDRRRRPHGRHRRLRHPRAGHAAAGVLELARLRSQRRRLPRAQAGHGRPVPLDAPRELRADGRRPGRGVGPVRARRRHGGRGGRDQHPARRRRRPPAGGDDAVPARPRLGHRGAGRPLRAHRGHEGHDLRPAGVRRRPAAAGRHRLLAVAAAVQVRPGAARTGGHAPPRRARARRVRHRLRHHRHLRRRRPRAQREPRRTGPVRAPVRRAGRPARPPLPAVGGRGAAHDRPAPGGHGGPRRGAPRRRHGAPGRVLAGQLGRGRGLHLLGHRARHQRARRGRAPHRGVRRGPRGQQPPARGAERPARGGVAPQERVPGEHLARAAHAAQRHDRVPPARARRHVRLPGGGARLPAPGAGVLAAPARAHQRRAGHRQDRGRQAQPRDHAGGPVERCSTRSTP